MAVAQCLSKRFRVLPQAAWKAARVLRVVFAVAALSLSPSIYTQASVAAETPEKAATASADPMAPIVVGPRTLVGKASLGEKAANTVIGGLVGSVLGGSGSKSPQPKTRRDPTRKSDYLAFTAAAIDTETRARARWTDDGLLVSSRIEDSPGKGTFQAIFLESCDGRRLYPQRFDIYDLWNESSISVSWSKTSMTNGQVTSRESGGWSDNWSDGFATFNSAAGGNNTAVPGAWQQLGFDRAQGGVRQIGAYFDLSPEDLAALGETALVVHTTRPLEDPVITSPAQWLLTPGSDQQPQLNSTTAQQRWQFSSAVCEQQGSVLVAAAGQPNPGSEPFEGTPRPPRAGAAATETASTGLVLPPGIQVVKVTGTGRTTGHIADMIVHNPGDQPVTLPGAVFFIPSTGKYQSYVGRTGSTAAIPPGATQTVPVTGYCGDVHRPPVPAGESLPPPDTWIVPSGNVQDIVIPDRAGSAPPGRALVPGTDTALPRALDSDQEPLLAAPLLLAAMLEIERKTDELQASGDLQTPFSGSPDREREAVIQQTLWIYAAELEGEPYTREDFTARMEQQYEDRSGVPITAAKPEEQEKLQQGADDFWDSFELVGVEAKVLASPDAAAPATGTAVDTEAKQAPVPGATTEVVHDGCPATEHIHHSPRQVNVIIANSYGDEDSRKKITDGIRAAVESQEPAYVTSTPPATAYSLWRDDAVGGISSAYAKSVFLEENKQDWVWSTDPLKTEAKGTGTHTLSFKPGPQCKATVAGAGLMWIKSSSEAFDPLERSIEVFRALDAVKELSVKYVTRKLPPGIDDAIEAGVEAITDPASDTYAAASGNATLVVGGSTDGGVSANRVVYKRKDKEDKAIIGGGATVKKFFASDVRPNSLTSRIDAGVVMEAGATGNGFAKAYLESVYGTLLVGVCECPAADGTTISVKLLTDVQMFIRTDAAKGAVDVALRDLKAAANRINQDIQSGKQDIDGAALKKRAEAELRKWGDGTAGERFKPVEGRSAESSSGA